MMNSQLICSTLNYMYVHSTYHHNLQGLFYSLPAMVKMPFMLFALLLLISFLSVSSQVTLSPPPGDVCYGDVVELLCQPTGSTAQYRLATTVWRENMMPIIALSGTPFSLETVNVSRDKLIINVTRDYFRGNMSYGYQCHYLLGANNKTNDSQVVNITPTVTEYPAPPTLREPITITPSTVTLEVDHNNTMSCFESCTFQYEVKVQPTGSHMSISTTTHSTNVFNVSGLSGGTRYRAEIVAVCVEESTIRSDPLNVNFTTRMEDGTTVTPTTPGPPESGTDGPSTEIGLIAGVTVVCIVIVVGAIAMIIFVILFVKSRKKSKVPPSRKEVRNEEVSYQTVQYADLYFSSTRPVPAPASDKVLYSETVGDTSTPPKIPKKAVLKNARGTFQKDILANMDGSGIFLLANNGTCLRDNCSRRKCDHTSLKAFPVDILAVYKDTMFVANCIENPNEDITTEDVSRIIKAKQGLEATKGFLICNQDFMSMDLLVQLEENDCFFVGVRGHGKENWDERMLDKLTAFFT